MTLLLALEEGAVAFMLGDTLGRGPALKPTAPAPRRPLGVDKPPLIALERPGALQATPTNGDEGPRPRPRPLDGRALPAPLSAAVRARRPASGPRPCFPYPRKAASQRATPVATTRARLAPEVISAALGPATRVHHLPGLAPDAVPVAVARPSSGPLGALAPPRATRPTVAVRVAV